jgi:DNA polymerase-3 subunit alpha
MELLVEERAANGRFHSLDDFARRVDPRLLNKRQVETLAGAGAFDSIAPDRAGVFAAAETILAVAQRTQESRTSGQGGLFGEAEPGGSAIQLPTSARWTLSQRINAEKDAFGFYFSAHPLDRYAHLARSQGTRSLGSLDEVEVPEGGRVGATIAALIEDARWRVSARGKRYMMATISDVTGQTIASCFDDAVAKDLEDTARAGGCAMLTVELDRRAGEETARVAIRRVQPFESLANTARLVLELAVDQPEVYAPLARLIGELRGGRGEVRVRAPLPQGGEASVILGRDFLLDGEIVAKIEALPGVRWARLDQGEGARLALVG